MHRIEAINIYPIKSLGGISVDTSKAEIEGLQYDRRWMLVDNTGQFLTQRENADMALFKCKIVETDLVVSYGDDSIYIPMSHYSNHIEKVKVWNSKLKGHEVSPEVSQWFSEHLGLDAKLIKMTSISKRYKRLFTSPFSTYMSFADGYPYLILSLASMDKLNGLLDKPLDINRFRANIIVSASEAHDEDNWGTLDMGTAQFKVIKPCARCVVTTIDQLTSHKGVEPLKTLASYRKWNNKIWFGANTILLKEGLISIGDEIHLKTV